jgi:hypothetical protein
LSRAAALPRAAALGFEDYDPSLVIDAVNELQSLGNGALDAVGRFLAGEGDGLEAPGLFWVLRVLCDLPGGVCFPAVELGEPTVAPPPVPDRLPRFPVVVVDDVPLLPLRGYTLSGFAQSVSEHLDFFQAHGAVRAAPLVPMQDLAALDEAFTRVWGAAYGGHPPREGLDVAREQLARFARR